jgi:unsaturated chondroitin disaccharide hydrolase
MMAFAEAWRLTGDPAYQSFLVRSAGSLVRSFNAGQSCVGAFRSDLRGVAGGRTHRRYPDLVYPVVISSLMSQEQLFTASGLPGGKREWYDEELAHTLRVVADFVRPDDSTYDLVDYHADCPARPFRLRATYKASDPTGTWARGQAFALHGPALAFEHTRHPQILDAARKVADHFLFAPTIPADGIPCWDLRFGPTSPEPRDTSAAAIAAADLLQLAAAPGLDRAAGIRTRTAPGSCCSRWRRATSPASSPRG